MAVKKVNIIFETDTSYSNIFWDEDGCEIGDFNTIYLENKEVINLPDIAGLKEWHSKTDIYDPYTSHTEFQIDGFEDWVNEGYRFAMQIRKLLPDYVSLYYGFWHNFGDNEWRYCKSLITK